MPGPSTFYGNPNNTSGGLGMLPNLSPIKPKFGNAMKGGYDNIMATPVKSVATPMKTNFNPYAVGASVLGQIGGGQRAIIGNDVWKTGGALSGTGVGNATDKLGDLAGQFGPTGAIVGLGLKGFSDIANLVNYDPKVSDLDITSQLMQEGGPTLRIGDKIGAASGIKKEGDKMAGQGALAGLKTGAAIGTAFGPLGAVIGGALGTAGGFLLGNRKKQKAYDAYGRAMGEVDESTSEFNQANLTSAQQGYGEQRRSQMMSRERNPYLVGYNSPFTV